MINNQMVAARDEIQASDRHGHPDRPGDAGLQGQGLRGDVNGSNGDAAGGFGGRKSDSRACGPAAIPWRANRSVTKEQAYGQEQSGSMAGRNGARSRRARRRRAEAAVTLVPSGEEALAVLWSPQPSDPGPPPTVEEILVASGKLDGEKLLQARSIQATSRGKKITQILQEMAAVGEEDIQQAVAEVMGLPFEPIDPKKVDRRAFEYLPSTS